MNNWIYLTLGFVFALQACDRYLDIKPRSNMVVPETLDELESLLEHTTVMNSYHEIIELQADDFYFEDTYWRSFSVQVDRNAYVWEKDLYGTTESHAAWSQPYTKIFYANAVLDGLGGIDRTETNKAQYDRIRGWALFSKAEAVFLLAQLYADVYDPETAGDVRGIPIPMSADVNEKVYRPSLAYTFGFITEGLLESQRLLGATPDFSRPSKGAAHGLLARVYLYMGDYDNALWHADRSLDLFDDLMDMDTESTWDFKKTLLFRFLSPTNNVKNNTSTNTLIDTLLLDMYGSGDLRPGLFFRKNTKGQFIKNGINNLGIFCFAGLDADEQFLIRAECYARQGQVGPALQDLNHLLVHRFRADSFTPYASADKEEVLGWVLTERRKELVFRGLRWSDLRRLNREGYAITLVRKLGSQTFTLPPGDPRWVLPIPHDEVNQSQIPQNER